MKTVNSISLEHTEPLVEHTLGKHPTLSSNKSEAISDPGSISTTALFQKPIVFANNIEWSVSQAINTIVYGLSLLDIFQMLNISPGGQSLRGNTFFRSGARIELKLTSSPFHSGKLVFYYIPPGVQTENREDIYSKVLFPCVYVDAGNSTTGVLDIPYVAIKDFFSTINPDTYSDFGDIRVAVVNPLRIGTGGPTSVQLALTLHPTQNQIAVPVLAHDINLQGLERFYDNEVAEGNKVLDSSNPLELLNNIKPNTADFLFEKLRDIVFSLVTPDEHISRSTTQAMLNKPIDTSIKEPDTPKILPKPANPNNTTTQTKVNNSAPTLSNLTGMGTEHFSLIPEQTVVLNSPNSEMNLKRVAQTPSLIRIGEWTDAQNSGSLLFKVPIDPMVAPFVPTTGQTSGVYYPTFLSHVIEPFAFWRGSIDYHFSFASTDQHKGKVIAAWIPFDELRNDVSITLPNPTIEQLSLYPNEVFDLSLNKEFTFSVPYNSETPFRKVNEYNTRIYTTDGRISGLARTDYSLGTLVLYVYNKLSHPSTVSSTINFNVYIKAGQDFQFRALKFNDDGGNQFQKINYVTLQSLDMIYESTREGMTQERVNRVGISPRGLTKTSFQEDDSEEHLGTLLQKYYPQFGYNLTLPTNNISKISIASNPGLSYRSPRDVTEPVLNPDPRWRNLIAHYRDIYAFWEGSLNYFIIHNTTVNNPVILMASHDPSDFLKPLTAVNNGQAAIRTNTYLVPLSLQTVTIPSDVDLSETSIYSHISNIRVNPTVEVTTPHRSIYRRLYTTDFRNSTTDTLDQDRTIGTVDIVYSNPSATEQTVSALVYQSVGDDFQFKYLIPPPTLKSRR